MYIPTVRKFNHYGKCPGCGLLNDVDLDECNHCHRRFSKPDKVAILTYAHEQKQKGLKLGIYVGLALLVGLMFVSILW
jgi:hypothetical protein